MADQQLEFAKQLHALLVQQGQILKQNLEFTKQMAESFNLAGAAVKDTKTSVESMNASIAEANQNNQSLGVSSQDIMEKLSGTIKDGATNTGLLSTAFDKFTGKLKAIVPLTASFDGFIQGIKFSAHAFTSLIGIGESLAQTITHIGLAIITAPFKMLQNLINMADSGGSNELQQALEDIRKEFGYLNKTSGQAIRTMAYGMRGQLANTGLSVWRVFGNIAERLKYVTEYVKNLGPLFDALNFSVGRGGAEALGAYNKALGLTEEGQRAVARRATESGQEINEVNRQMANYAIQLSKAFHVTQKEVSRDMGTMLADVQHFGHLTPQVLGQAAVFARKLGIEIKNLGSVMDKWLNFEDAAKGASQLAQAFGMNIDSLQMMQAQDPAQKIELMRRAFFRTGRTVEQMSYQERRLLAQQTGLDDAAIALTFSLKNQSLSYDQIQKKGTQASKTQLTQAQALQQLSGAIERLVRQGQMGQGGFLDRFLQGFSKGIRWSWEFRKMLWNIRAALMTVYWSGVQVGRLFVQYFPGVKDFFKGISGIFDRQKFRKLMRGVVETFRTFFLDMTTNPRTALPKLFENLKKKFFDWFSANSANGQKILNGIKVFLRALSHIIGSGLKMAMEGLTEGITFITDLITGKRKLGDINTDTSFLGEIFHNLIDGAMQVWPPLWAAVKKLFMLLFNKVKDFVSDNIGIIAAAFMAPAVIGAVTRGLFSLFFLAIGAAFKKLAMAGVERAAAGSGIVGKIGRVLSGAKSTKDCTKLQEAMKCGNDVAKSPTDVKPTAGPSFLRMLAILGIALLVVGAVLLLIAVIKAAHFTTEDIGRAVFVIGGAALLCGAAALAAKAAQIASTGVDWKSMAIGFAVITVALIAMAALTYGIVKAFSGITTAEVLKCVPMFAAMGALFVAATIMALIATAIGTIVIATQGVAGVGFLVGLAMVALTMYSMTEMTKGIIRDISAMPTGSNILEKSQVFLAAAKVLTEFMTAFSKIALSMSVVMFASWFTPSFWGNPLDKVKDTLKLMSDKVIEIVRLITTSMQGMNTEGAETKGRVFVDIFTAIVGLIGAITPIISQGQMIQSFVASSGGNTANLIREAGNRLQQIITSIGNVASTIFDTIKNLPEMTEGQKNAGAAIGSVLGAITGVINAVKIMPNFNEFDSVLRTDQQVMNNIQAYMNIVRFNITELIRALLVPSGRDHVSLLTLIGTFFKGLVTSMSGFNTALIPIIEPMSKMIVAIFEAVGKLVEGVGQAVPTGAAVGTNANLAALIVTSDIYRGFLELLLNQMQGFIGNMLAKLVDLTRTITPSQLKTLPKVIDVLTKVFEFLKMVGEAGRSISEGRGTDTGGGARDWFRSIFVPMTALNQLLSGAGITQIQALLTNVSRLMIPRSIDRTIKTVQSLFELLKGVGEAARTIGGEHFDAGSIFTTIQNVMDLLLTNSHREGLFTLSNVDRFKKIFENIAKINPPGGINTKIHAIETFFDSIKALKVALDGATEAVGTGGTITSSIATLSNFIKELTTSDTRRGITNRENILVGDNLNNALAGINPTKLASGARKLQQISANLRTMGDAATGMEEVNTALRGHTAASVTTMVASINETIHNLEAVGRAGDININTKLRALALNLGLGSNEQFVITRGNVSLNVNVNVVMDAEELEWSLAHRPGQTHIVFERMQNWHMPTHR